jgi:hypothetical protein
LEINPYQATTEFDSTPVSVSFEGVVDESMYSRFLPAGERTAFLVFGAILGLIVLPGMLLSLFFGIFIARDWGMIIGSSILICIMTGPLIYCLRYPTNEEKARRYLKVFPDLVGSMQGTFDANGLVLWDDCKMHWFPWMLLSNFRVSKAGVRVQLEQDHRRFLALGSELFQGDPRNDLELLRKSHRVTGMTNDQLVELSAKVFERAIDDPGFYMGGALQGRSWNIWVEMMIAPVSFVLFFILATFGNGWNLSNSIIVVVLGVACLPSIRRLIHHIRNPAGTILFHWGWLDDREIVQGTGLHAIKVPLDSATIVIWDAHTIEVKDSRFNSVFLVRTLFRDTGRFDEFLEASRAKSVIPELGASENETVGNPEVHL